MRIKNLDLVLAIAISLLNLVWATKTNHHPQILGILLALPQVFFFPGYTLVEIFFHRHPLESVRCFVLSIGLSIALIILSGIVLNRSSWGLTTVSWAIYLTSMTSFFSLVAMFTRAGSRAFMVKKILLLQLYGGFRKHIVSVTFLAIAMGLAVLSAAYSSYSVEHQRRVGFTQLWILQPDPTAKNCSVVVGVDSFEFTSTQYRVFMTTKGTLTTTWSSPIHLPPQKSWKALRPITVKSSGDVEILVQLYLATKPGTVYRYVHLTLHSAKSKQTQAWQCTV